MSVASMFAAMPQKKATGPHNTGTHKTKVPSIPVAEPHTPSTSPPPVASPVVASAHVPTRPSRASSSGPKQLTLLQAFAHQANVAHTDNTPSASPPAATLADTAEEAAPEEVGVAAMVGGDSEPVFESTSAPAPASSLVSVVSDAATTVVLEESPSRFVVDSMVVASAPEPVVGSFASPPRSPVRATIATSSSVGVVGGTGVVAPSSARIDFGTPPFATPPHPRPMSSPRVARHTRSQTVSSALLPPASPLRSPMRLFDAAHRRHGSLSSSPIDARYLARLAPSGTTSGASSLTNSPRKSPLVGFGSPQRDELAGSSSLPPRRLHMPSTGSPIPSPAASPSRRRTAASPAHPLLHAFPSPRKRPATDADIIGAFPFAHSTTPATASAAAALAMHSPALAAAVSVATPLAAGDATLRALQEECGDYDWSDRFIPSRAGSNLSHGYTVRDDEESSRMQENAGHEAHAAAAAASGTSAPHAFSHAYGILLRSEILGSKDGSSACSAINATTRETREQNNAALLVHRPGVNPVVGSSADAPSATPAASAAAAPSTTSPARATTTSATAAYPQAFRFKSPRHTVAASDPFQTPSLGRETHRLLASASPAQRVISKMPFKVLDAPGLKDDFYLNLVDWSAQNVVAVALGSCVYLWSGATTKVAKLCDLDETVDSVTSVGWTVRGNHLAVGTRTGQIQLWDVVKQKCVQTMEGHTGRVGSLAWNSHLLASGSRDRSILLHDPRAGSARTSALHGHAQEVCGMKWSYDEHQLASGGNDNKLLIWSATQSKPVLRFDQHTAAVKAIAWSPHQHGLLCSGGGTADRCIRFWSTVTGSPVSHIDTGSQVCNLLWSRNVNEIVSTHGYSLNQVIAWKYPTMQPVTTLVGHAMRVLYLAISPDGQTILTGAGDETLRFWNIFPSAEAKGGGGSGTTFIRPTAADQLIR